jgi:hypothetical protein
MGEASGGKARQTRQADSDSLTREKEEAVPVSAVSMATALLNLMKHDDDLRGGENGEQWCRHR